MEELKSLIDFSRFSYYPSAIYDNRIAIATDTLIVILQKSNLPNATKFVTEEYETVRFENIEEDDRVSLLFWIEENKICVGFESGLLVCYSLRGEIFRFHGTTSPIQQIRILDDNGKKKLWLLYEEGLLIMVSCILCSHFVVMICGKCVDRYH